MATRNGLKRKPFRAAKQNRIFQDIVEQIQSAILDGDYRPGSKLPPERELKEMFRTSRGTLREALRVLEQKGLIEIRLGVNGGAVVKGSVTEPMAESLGLMLRYRKISLGHLHEFREDVEGIVTAKAAARADAADVEKLARLLDQTGPEVSDTTESREQLLEIDKQFHQTLAQITGNPIYIFMQRIIHDNIHTYYDEFLTLDDYRIEENYQDLNDILAAVKEGKINQARELAQNHVRQFSKYMRPRGTAPGRQGD